MDWAEGTVLLVSDRPIPGGSPEIADSELQALTGGDGYTCTDLLQEDDVVYCAGFCEGYYEYYPERWGCESAESGMCIEDEMLRSADCECRFLSTPCNVTGDWSFYYMLACS